MHRETNDERRIVMISVPQERGTTAMPRRSRDRRTGVAATGDAKRPGRLLSLPGLRRAFAGLLVSIAPTLAPSPVAAATARGELGLQPVAGFDGHLFSSYLYATTFFPDTGFNVWREFTLRQYGDSHGQVGLIVDHRDDLYLTPTIKVVVEANDFMGESELEKELMSAAIHRFFPKIDWDFEKLRALDEERVLTLKYRVEVDGRPYRKVTLPVRLHPIHDCPFELRKIDVETLQGVAADAENGDGAADRATNIDQNWMFAAYVNERHPAIVDEIVPALTHQGFVRNLTGYQLGDPEEVHRQVLSAWKLLRDRGVRYSSLATLGGGGHVGWQHVRTLEQSLAAGQANCVDGSVLLASILAAIGLDPFLVITPTHCYLGFHLGPTRPDGGRDFSLLETTLLGAEVDPATVAAAPLADFRRIARGAGSSDTSPHGEDAAIASYVAALLAGMSNWNRDQPHLQPAPAEPADAAAAEGDSAASDADEEEGEGGDAGDESTAEGDEVPAEVVPPPPPSPDWGYAIVHLATLRAKGLGSIQR